MAGFIGEIVAKGPDAVLVRVPVGECGAACGCGRRKETTVSLPSARGQKLKVSLRPGDQCVLLANTLFFPLCGFIVGAVIAQWMFSNDVPAFVGAIVGFGAGLLACRPQSFDRVVIEEVSNE